MKSLAETTTAEGAVPAGTRERRLPTSLLWILGLAAVGVTATILIGGLPRQMVGLLAIVMLLLQLALGVPIGFAMILSAGIGLVGTLGFDVAWASLGNVAIDSVTSWSLNVIPLFVLMGIAMWKGGITAKAYVVARQWLGWLPGGLAVATNMAGAGLSATSGSTVGVTLALSRMSLPEMLKAGYRPSLATASVAMAGTLGQVIPPSILLVIYAGVAGTSVGPQLLAGLLPGVLLALGFCLVAVLWALVAPSVAPRVGLEGVTWPTRFRTLGGLVPILAVGIVVVGGIATGLLTASESAAIGAIAALVVSWISFGRGNRGPKSTWRFLHETFVESVRAIAGLFIIVVGALLLTRLLTISGLAQEMTAGLLRLDLDRVTLLILLIVFYIFLGMFLESLPMILLTVPLLQAPLEAIGVDMIWFGVFMIIMCEIGMVFPPIGILTFIVHRLAQDPQVNLGHRITLADVFRGVMPFVAVAVIVAIVLIIWPAIPLWLPNMSSAG
jgi:C4-dicarboxylate transporter, DctM subunit